MLDEARGLARSVVGRALRVVEADALPPADHRPWPLPAAPWVMVQTWETLLFAHWPVPPAELARHVPSELPLDTFEGKAWIGIAPFVLTGLRLRAVPPIPPVAAFPELNVRTYVRRDGKAGVYFFSLDAGSTLAVVAARRLYGLPYHRADFDIVGEGSRVHYVCRRREGGAPAARFAGDYWPSGPVRFAAVDSLDAWLTERYCLYTVDARGVVYRAEIHHAPWPLQPAEAAISVNTMAAASGLALSARRPRLHFAERLDVHVWLPAPVTS